MAQGEYDAEQNSGNADTSTTRGVAIGRGGETGSQGSGYGSYDIDGSYEEQGVGDKE